MFALGLDVGILPGGAHLRERLQGEPPGLHERIAPATRVEYYRRHDEAELWSPIVATESMSRP